jgi:hypothetical protein
MLIISNALQIMFIGLKILSITFILGMFWYIFCKSIEDFYYDIDYGDLNKEQTEKYYDNFIVYYDLANKSATHKTVTLTYFAFTTLSTVGFGDYAPRSDVERIVGSLILLMGVAIFSYVMGIFSDLL